MTDVAASDFRHPRRYVRLDTILRLRWLAALGQLPFPECRAIASARLPRRHSVDQDRCTGSDDDIDVRLRGMAYIRRED